MVETKSDYNNRWFLFGNISRMGPLKGHQITLITLLSNYNKWLSLFFWSYINCFRMSIVECSVERWSVTSICRQFSSSVSSRRKFEIDSRLTNLWSRQDSCYPERTLNWKQLMQSKFIKTDFDSLFHSSSYSNRNSHTRCKCRFC